MINGNFIGHSGWHALPDDLSLIHERISHRSAQALKDRFARFIRDNYENPELTPRMIAEEIGISKSYLYRVVGSGDKSVHSWLMDFRLQRAHEMLMTRPVTVPVKRIAHECGFKTASHFTQSFRFKYGLAPKDFRKAQRARWLRDARI